MKLQGKDPSFWILFQNAAFQKKEKEFAMKAMFTIFTFLCKSFLALLFLNPYFALSLQLQKALSAFSMCFTTVNYIEEH